MNRAAALSRSVSGKHLSFRSNLHGIEHLGLTAPSPNSATGRRSGVRRLSESLSFGSPLNNYSEKCESKFCILSEEGQFGFDYAKERLEKRQMFLRSYHLTTKAEEAASSNSSTLSHKRKACFFKVRNALWTVIACNLSRAGFLRIHRHAKASSF